MSVYDKGRFGELLVELKATGRRYAVFLLDNEAGDEDDERWRALSTEGPPGIIMNEKPVEGCGRTGEEALRRLLEALAKP